MIDNIHKQEEQDEDKFTHYVPREFSSWPTTYQM